MVRYCVLLVVVLLLCNEAKIPDTVGSMIAKIGDFETDDGRYELVPMLDLLFSALCLCS